MVKNAAIAKAFGTRRRRNHPEVQHRTTSMGIMRGTQHTRMRKSSTKTTGENIANESEDAVGFKIPASHEAFAFERPPEASNDFFKESHMRTKPMYRLLRAYLLK